ncbi:MAG: hypothetical protein AAFZ52_01045 [Bacteroidota bacterium]
MSFGGATSSMIASNKANLALRRGRDHLFDREIRTKVTRRSVGPDFQPAPAHVRKKFREQLREEIRRENLYIALLGAVVILAGAGIYFFV